MDRAAALSLEGTAGGSSADDWLSVLSLAGAAAFELDVATLEVTFLGDASMALLGLESGSRMLGERFWREVVPGEEHRALVEMFRAVGQDGRPRWLEHRLLGPNIGDVYVRTSVMRSGAGTLGKGPRLRGAMLDITTSRQNERQWREVEAWLVALGEALPFDVWICDRQDRCVLQNPASMRHFGNVLGQRGDYLQGTPELTAEWPGKAARVLKGETVREELHLTREGDTTFLVRLLAPVYGLEGVDGVLGVDLDVTDLKHAEQRLRESMEDLARAQDQAVRQSQLAALGELAAVVAHEVRNPLGSIQNSLALLKRGGSGENGAALLRIIDEEAGRIGWLVSNLLDFVRPMVPQLESRLLGPLVEEALAETLRQEGLQGNVVVQTALAAEVPSVEVDTHLFRLAVTNVIRNALQAMAGEGELVLSLGLEEGADGKRFARVAVEDTGPGVSPELEKRLFEPFFTTRSTGSGLGLPIVRRVMSEHQGTVSLGNRQPRGTACVLRLPVARER